MGGTGAVGEVWDPCHGSYGPGVRVTRGVTSRKMGGVTGAPGGMGVVGVWGMGGTGAVGGT